MRPPRRSAHSSAVADSFNAQARSDVSGRTGLQRFGYRPSPPWVPPLPRAGRMYRAANGRHKLGVASVERHRGGDESRDGVGGEETEPGPRGELVAGWGELGVADGGLAV